MSIPRANPRMNSVLRRLLRNGALIWLGSRLLPATSASIGVKRRAFVSLTRVMKTERSARSRSSKHSAESAAQNHDPFYYRRHLQPGFWLRAEHMLCEITEALGDEAERGTVQHPANQSWKMCSHLFCVPLRHLPGNQWERDHADQTPQWNAQCTRGH